MRERDADLNEWIEMFANWEFFGSVHSSLSIKCWRWVIRLSCNCKIYYSVIDLSLCIGSLLCSGKTGNKFFFTDLQISTYLQTET